MLTAKGNPTYSSLNGILRAVGLRFTITAELSEARPTPRKAGYNTLTNGAVRKAPGVRSREAFQTQRKVRNLSRYPDQDWLPLDRPILPLFAGGRRESPIKSGASFRKVNWKRMVLCFLPVRSAIRRYWTAGRQTQLSVLAKSTFSVGRLTAHNLCRMATGFKVSDIGLRAAGSRKPTESRGPEPFVRYPNSGLLRAPEHGCDSVGSMRVCLRAPKRLRGDEFDLPLPRKENERVFTTFE